MPHKIPRGLSQIRPQWEIHISWNTRFHPPLMARDEYSGTTSHRTHIQGTWSLREYEVFDRCWLHPWWQSSCDWFGNGFSCGNGYPHGDDDAGVTGPWGCRFGRICSRSTTSPMLGRYGEWSEDSLLDETRCLFERVMLNRSKSWICFTEEKLREGECTRYFGRMNACL